MPSKLTLVKQVALPSQSAVATAFKSVNLADAFSIQLPSDASIESRCLGPIHLLGAAILDRSAHQRPRCNRCGIWSEDRQTPCNAL